MEHFEKVIDEIKKFNAEYAEFLEDYFKLLKDYDSFEGKLSEDKKKVEFIIKYDYIEIYIICDIDDIEIEYKFYDSEDWSEFKYILMPQLPSVINTTLVIYGLRYKEN